MIENKKARYRYFFYEKLEVGIELTGFEAKNVRANRGSIENAYVQVLNGELWLMNSSIQDNGAFSDKNERRRRKLLCHKKEIRELKAQSEAKGMTLVPLRLYVKNGRIKLEIATARGKNAADKRQTLKERTLEKETRRAF